ncbi:hypothetical protein AB0B31_07510 [Catellatospora citrea]|uniref:hypothetical protein n=1 Tax=Catellatospora citrea TaxID=53366 RepID=UPI0034090E9C
MMPWYGGGMPGWGMLFLAAGTLFLLAVLIVGAVALGRYTSRATPAPQEPATPQRILAQRQARGEIGEQEYSRMMALVDDAGRHSAT